MAEIKIKKLKGCKYTTDADIENEALNRTQFYSIHASRPRRTNNGRDETRKNQHTMQVGMVLVVRPYDTIYIYIYSDKHTSAREEIKISPPQLI